MADDYQDIGTGIEVFPFTPNWVSRPKSKWVIARDLRVFPGTLTEVDTLSTRAPFDCEAGFLLINMSDVYDMIDFFYNRKARVYRFWFRNPVESFSLKEASNAGGAGLICFPNLADVFYEGYERIYLRYKDTGDYMSRKVNNIIYDDNDNDIELILNTVLARSTTPDNVEEFGRLTLCRFDIDTLTLNMKSNTVAEVQLKFHELVREYEEV